MSEYYDRWRQLTGWPSLYSPDYCDGHGYSEIEITDMLYDCDLELIVCYWKCPNCGNRSKEVFK